MTDSVAKTYLSFVKLIGRLRLDVGRQSGIFWRHIEIVPGGDKILSAEFNDVTAILVASRYKVDLVSLGKGRHSELRACRGSR